MSETIKSCELLNKDNTTSEILINKLLNEVEELCKTSTAKFLFYDKKVSELCTYIKENLSDSIRCLLADMKFAGELDKIITDVVLAQFGKLEFDVSELNSKTAGIITPQLFGAIGDGLSDDTEAIKKCIKSGKLIYIPAGTYRIAETIELTGNECFIGTKDSVFVQETPTLFNIKNYYNSQCIFDNITVDVDNNTFIKANRKTWGSSYICRNMRIKNCGNDTVINYEGYNITFDNVIFECGKNATGTMIRLCDESAETFSNVISFNSCVLSGNSNIDLLDCSKSYRVNAINTTFTGCKTAIKGEALCSGCWFETVELCSDNPKTNFIDCHFSDVTRGTIKNMGEDDLYTTPATVYRPTYKTSGELLSEVYKRQAFPIFRPVVSGMVNGVYNEFLPFSLYSNKIISNIPINTFYKEGTGNTVHLPVGELLTVHKGTLFIEIVAYKVNGTEVKQKILVRGILKNNTFTELEKTDSDTTYKSTVGWDNANQMFSVTDYHEGTLIAKAHIERVDA